MAQSTREAVMLNNLGADRFAAGELSGALDAYRRALAFIPANADRIEDTLRSEVATEPSSLGIAFKSALDSTRKPPSDEPFIYHKPLVFNRLVPETRDGASAFCGVVVFNMALIMDMMRSRGGGDAHTTKALHLYSSCVDLFSKTSSRVDLTSAMAAACNNKARIYFEQENFEECKREMQSLQRYIRIADQSPTKADFLVEEDFQGILLNMLLLWPGKTAPAA